MYRPDNATIKRLLSRRFPSVKFSVTSGRGTAASWSRISWTDGPSSHLVTDFLGTVGSAPGYMDNTDYYHGERVNVSRQLSDGFRARIAARLLSGKVVPPVAVWSHNIRKSNGGGYYDLNDCVYQAASARYESDLERAKFDANAWLEAWAHNEQEAPSVVQYA